MVANKLKMRLIKFGSKTCGACIAMDKAKTLERFAEAHPDVQILRLDISDENGDSPPPKALGDVDYKTNYKLSDAYGVEALPTLILEVENVGEVVRIEGAANLKQLNEMYDSTMEIAERSRALPWS